MAGQRDVFGGWLVGVHPMRMRVVEAEEFETALAEFYFQPRDILRRDHVIPDRIGGDIFRGERACDDVVLACEEAAAFAMRLTAGVRQNLSKHFATTLDGGTHIEILQGARKPHQAWDRSVLWNAFERVLAAAGKLQMEIGKK